MSTMTEFEHRTEKKYYLHDYNDDDDGNSDGDNEENIYNDWQTVRYF